ncbi:CHAT domain-containing protein [Paraburkholderia oxyphila]|uniref:CHAT domain-containing protein n=1 Tax=Paraburkholderia oxyphila TaxID=614212 RepID=UPI0004887FE3|nr:CHAT domain-containing protein [Paraburkholderia oxyphila]
MAHRTLNLVDAVLLAAALGLAGLACVACSPARTQTSHSTHAARSSSATPWKTAGEHERAIHARLAGIEDGEKRYALLDSVSTEYFRAGMIADSVRVRELIVDDSKIGAGRRSLEASNLAFLYVLSHYYKKCDHFLALARTLARQTTPAELETLPRDPAYAFFAAEAERVRLVENRNDLALLKYQQIADLAWHNLNDPTLSEKRHLAAVNALYDSAVELIRILAQNNRPAEALSYANELSWDAEHRPDMRASVIQHARLERGLAIARESNNDYDGALAAIDAALAGEEHGDPGKITSEYADCLRQRLLIALAMGRIGDYRGDVEVYERVVSLNPFAQRRDSANGRESLSLASRGQWQAASKRLDPVIAYELRVEGAQGPFYKYSTAMQMLYRLQDPVTPAKEADVIAYVSPIVGTQGGWNDATSRGAYVEDGALEMSTRYLVERGGDDAALAFRIAEHFQMDATQDAMNDGAARLAAATPALRELVEREQALRYRQNTARLALARADAGLSVQDNDDESAAPDTPIELAREDRAQREANAQLAALRKQIAEQFPLYRQLASPAIPAPREVGAVLHPGEVYVDLYAGRDASYAFVVHPGGAFRAIRLAVTHETLKTQIAALRASFDAGVPPTRPGELAGFDLNAAAALYSALIAPIEAEFAGADTVYLATSGLLASVPFDVLVTQPASSLSGASWWIEKTLPVRIPSAAALVLARTYPAPHAQRPLLAFADPSFDGLDAEPPEQGAPAATLAASRAFPLDAGTRAFDYHRVAPLPETLAEARSIAAALGAPQDSVRWGTRASRSAVMKADLSSDRVVLFATHGISPGEVPGWRKSGLALAYEGHGLVDSILTADDIVTLRLNADWVVLSACNTGLATGNAGDAISALSRAFFAAGARSLLVTQWAVESQSAARITAGVFEAYAANPALSKAGALAQAERDMLAGKDGKVYRHPYYWGAYELAGDAAR